MRYREGLCEGRDGLLWGLGLSDVEGWGGGPESVSKGQEA